MSMESTLLHRAVPNGGEPLPVIGLGTWQAFDFGQDTRARTEAAEALGAFIDAGARVIDSSPMYANAEAAVGDLLAQTEGSSNIFAATKVWTSGRDAGKKQIAESFRKLRREQLDLLQVHNLLDVQTQLATLRELKAADRVRYLGITHYTASAHAEMQRLIEAGGIDFIQINYSLLEREAAARLLPAAAEKGVAVVINRPFAEGAVLARTRDKKLPGIAADYGCTSWAQLALKFILANPAVTVVIPGTRNVHHLTDNLAGGSGPMPDAAGAKRIAAVFDAL
jgi:aryl-alcohol dehydrogenase-like predicted oxidoreductase